MSLYRKIALAALGAGLLTSPALAEPKRDADRAFDAARRDAHAAPKHRAARDALHGRRRLSRSRVRRRHLPAEVRQDGRVIWVDVDAATGRIMGKSGRSLLLFPADPGGHGHAAPACLIVGGRCPPGRRAYISYCPGLVTGGALTFARTSPVHSAQATVQLRVGLRLRNTVFRGLTRMRVLIVEDEPNLGRQLRSTLEGAGYAVDLATDGEDGHYLGSTESYDAVILDLGLARSRRPHRARPVAEGRPAHARSRPDCARQLVGQGRRARRGRRRLSRQAIPDRGTDRAASRAHPPRLGQCLFGADRRRHPPRHTVGQGHARTASR